MNLLDKNWQEITFVAFDTETTGKYPLNSEICELAAVKYKGGEIIDSYKTLLKPSHEMTQEIIDIHHITNEMVKNAPLAEEKIPEFFEFIKGAVCMAHHAPFDLGFVSIEFEKMGLELPSLPALCTSLLSRKFITESSNHKLQTLVKLLDIDGGQAHRALDDAKACLEVGLECFRRAGEDATLEDLLKHQELPMEWQNFSLIDLQELERYSNLISAIRNKGSVEMTYDGGSRPGRPRAIDPVGLVRTPNGDFLVAYDGDFDRPPKRYMLDKISKTKLK